MTRKWSINSLRYLRGYPTPSSFFHIPPRDRLIAQGELTEWMAEDRAIHSLFSALDQKSLVPSAERISPKKMR